MNSPAQRVAQRHIARDLPRAERSKLVEQAYESTKNALIASLRTLVPTILREIDKIATQHGIDLLYLNWAIVSGKGWPSLPPKTRESLRTLQSFHLWLGLVPNEWSRMIVPDLEEESARDAAIKQVGEWFLGNPVKTLRRDYLATVWRKVKELDEAIPVGKDPNAGVLLLRDFKRRFVGDRFQGKSAVQRLVDMF